MTGVKTLSLAGFILVSGGWSPLTGRMQRQSMVTTYMNKKARGMGLSNPNPAHKIFKQSCDGLVQYNIKKLQRISIYYASYKFQAHLVYTSYNSIHFVSIMDLISHVLNSFSLHCAQHKKYNICHKPTSVEHQLQQQPRLVLRKQYEHISNQLTCSLAWQLN